MGDELGSARTSEDASADATDMERTCPATSWCSCGSQWPYASCLEPASRQLHKDPTVAVSLIFLLMLHHCAYGTCPLTGNQRSILLELFHQLIFRLDGLNKRLKGSRVGRIINHVLSVRTHGTSRLHMLGSR